jgi:tRNA modification GTPase
MTIFALSTAPGKAGVAIIRISGPLAHETIKHFGYHAPIIARYATLVKLCSPETNAMIDEALVLYFPAPHSFTGEDIIELQCHGSRAVIAEIIDSLSAMPGLRLAHPGEFSRRAFTNGKMDLTRAEGLADLVDAETRAQHRQAVRQMSGELEQLYEHWRKQLIHILAFIEAYIDFPDEDLPPSVIKEVTDDVASLAHSLELHLADNRRGQKIRDGLYITIIGAPNVGKSSLINWLAKRDVAIVSHIAGTTRDIIEVHLDIGGYAVIISDTAGLRESSDEIENEGIRRAIERAHSADLKIALCDATLLPQIDAATEALIDEKTLVVYNKKDLAPLAIAPGTLAISLHTGEGANELLQRIEALAVDMLAESDSPVISRARHRKQVQLCLEQLQHFHLHKAIELAAEDLRIAAHCLGQITGTIDIETILDEIFASFCIGK